MKTIAKLRLLLAIALGTLSVTCVLLFLGMVTEVSADPPTSWFVAPDGLNSLTCGQEVSPCLTINHAISQASIGATIIITPGTYTESLTLNKTITLTGAGMGQTIIRASSPGVTLTASGVVISGATIVGEGNGEGITVAAGLANVSILNSKIQSYTSGIWLNGGNGHLLQGNVIAGNSMGLQLNGGNGHLLQGNVITGNSIGLVAAGDLSFVANNNTISGSLTAGILFTGAGPITATLSGASGHANIFRNNGSANITVTLPSTNTNINARWNDWGANTIAGIEGTIYHGADDASLARVDFYTLTIAATPPIATADGVTPVYITGTLDGFVIPGAGDVISFTTRLGVLSAVTATTDASGQASVALTSTVAGAAVITATSGIAINNIQRATTTVDFTPGELATVTVTPNPVTVTVGITQTFNATGQDMHGNAVTITPTWGTNGGAIHVSSGVFTAQTSVASGLWVTATQGSISGTAVVNIVADAPHTVALVAFPVTQTVGHNSVLTATVWDQYSNSVANGTAVTLTVSRGSVVSPVTTTNGIATSLISDTLVGTRLITAASGSAPLITATVTFTPDTPYTVTLAAYPLSQTVNHNSTLTATVRDRYNNWVADGTTVVLTSSHGSVVSPVTTTNGIATSLISDTLVGTRLITATSGPAPSVTTTVTFTPDVPYTVTLIAFPISQTVDHNTVLTATVIDQFGNGVADNTPVNFGTDLGRVLTPRATTNGIATSLISATQALPAHVTANSGTALQGTTTVTFTPDIPNNMTLWAEPSSQSVGMSSDVKAIVTDRFGNNVANGTLVTFTTDLGSMPSPRMTTNGFAYSPLYSEKAATAHITATSGSVQRTTTVVFEPGSPYTVTLAAYPLSQTVGHNSALTATVTDRFNNRVADGASVTFTASRGSVVSPVTTTNGIATSLISDTLVGARIITATCESAQPGTTTVTFTPDTPYTVTLQAYPTSLIVGNNSVLTTTVYDRFGNDVENGTPVTLTVSRGSAVSPVTTTNGVARSWFSDTVVGTRTITAASGSAPSVTTTVYFSPGVPYSMTLIANPSSLTVTFSSLLQVTVRDQYLNPVEDGTWVTFTTDWGNVLPVATTNGLATSSIATTIAGTDHITATSGTARATTTVIFRPDVPNKLALQVNPSQQVVGNNSVLTATVRDIWDNLVESGIPVTFTVSRGSVVSPVTTTSGIATSLISDTLVGARLVTATTTGGVSGTTTVTFIPGAPYTVTLVATPTVQVVGNNSVLTATVYDRYSNLVANGASVTFTASRGNVVSPVTTTNGVATSLISDTLMGTRTITAASGSASSVTRTVTFIPGEPNTITVQVYPIDLIANSGATATITSTVLDLYGNLVAGEILTASFPITRMGAITIYGATNAAGQAIGAWTAGNDFISHTFLYVSNGVITGSEQVSLIGGMPETIAVQISSSSLIANSGMTSAVTATVTNIYGAKLSGVSLTGNILPPSLGSIGEFDFTNEEGQSFSIWTAGSVMTSGLLSIHWTYDDVSVTLPITLTSGPPQTLTVQVKPVILTAFSGATATITATVIDLYHNPIRGLTLSGETSPATLGSVSRLDDTNENGQAFGRWVATSNSTAGSGLLRVDAGGAFGTTPITLTPGHVYLPAILRNFMTQPIKNGDFSLPNLESWTRVQNPLPVTRSTDDPAALNNPAALLGNPAYPCHNVDEGYGSLSQSFIMPSVPQEGWHAVLKFKYHIYTDDKNLNKTPDGDLFEVWLNNEQVVSDMNTKYGQGCGNNYYIGQEKSHVMTNSPGETINLVFRVQNKWDRNFNTYVYVDDVSLEFEP